MKRILFIEDDYITIDGAVSYLELEGHEVITVVTVEAAFERLRYEAFDIVFLDVMLAPGEEFELEETSDGRYTGLKVLERVKENDVFKMARAARFFLVTNWREEPRIDAVAKKYQVRVIRKPLALATIQEVVS